MFNKKYLVVVMLGVGIVFYLFLDNQKPINHQDKSRISYDSNNHEMKTIEPRKNITIEKSVEIDEMKIMSANSNQPDVLRQSKVSATKVDSYIENKYENNGPILNKNSNITISKEQRNIELENNIDISISPDEKTKIGTENIYGEGVAVSISPDEKTKIGTENEYGEAISASIAPDQETKTGIENEYGEGIAVPIIISPENDSDINLVDSSFLEQNLIH